MKPAPFDYAAPQSLEETLALMDEHGCDAKILAGGQSLIPVMNFRLAQPAMLVDINGVAELERMEPVPDGGLRIGAMMRQRALERSALVVERAPLIFETMPYIAHPQIRNRGTIGGSLAHADPAGELPVLAVGWTPNSSCSGPAASGGWMPPTSTWGSSPRRWNRRRS